MATSKVLCSAVTGVVGFMAYAPGAAEQQASVDCLASLLTVLHSLSSAAYRQALPLCFDSTIAAHTRHMLDHDSCLLDGIDEQPIDYDNRQRNSLLQPCPKVASTRLAATCDRL